MKIDTDDISVFEITVSEADACAWLMDPGAEMVTLNQAIDEATSFAARHGQACVLLRIATGADTNDASDRAAALEQARLMRADTEIVSGSK